MAIVIMGSIVLIFKIIRPQNSKVKDVRIVLVICNMYVLIVHMNIVHKGKKFCKNVLQKPKVLFGLA